MIDEQLAESVPLYQAAKQQLEGDRKAAVGKKEDLIAQRNQARLKEALQRRAAQGDPWYALKECTKEHPMAGRTPEAREIVQRIVNKEKGEILVSTKKKELLRRQEEEEVEEEGATILRMKLQDIWKDKGSTVAQREVQRLL